MSVRYKTCQKMLVGTMVKKQYHVGDKVKRFGGVAKITAVNPDGTATANWVKPPKNPLNGKLQKAGGFAATLPALNVSQQKYANPTTGEIFNEEQTGAMSYETYTKKETNNNASNTTKTFFTKSVSL